MTSANMKMATETDIDNQAVVTPLRSSHVNLANPKNLSEILIGEKCIVRELIAPSDMPEWQTQLEDIGFIVGEPVTLMARGAFGGDPLVIRIGLSTFALRKAEAACVLVDVLQDKVAA